MKKKIIIGAFIFIVIVGIIFSITFFNKKNNTGKAYKKEALKKGDIEAIVVTSGSLNPVTIVDVGSQVSGRVSNLYVDFNSHVKKGQVLAELDQSLFITKVKQNEANYQSSKAALEKAKLTLANTKRKYDRALNLFEKDLISYEEKETAEVQYYSALADLQSAEARLEQAKSQLESSKVDLTYTIIKSPIDGMVINRNFNVGQTVAASFQAPVLFQIANDLSKMQVECSVDEADIGRVKEGQKVRFTVDAFPDDRFTGKVSQVRYSPEVIQNVVTYTTIVDVVNPELKLRPGMTAMVSIISGEAKNVLRVPNAALRFTPSLSPEDMKTLFQQMRASRSEGRQSTRMSPEGTPEQSKPQKPSGESRQPSGQMSFMMQKKGKQPFSLVWIEDEKGKLQPVSIKTGVTDNSYTEVIWGDLKEGQEVIIGESSGKSQNSSSGPRPGAGFMSIRR